MISRIIGKIIREIYRVLHPQLWGKRLQINGIPHIYCIEKLNLGHDVSINSGCVLQCYGGICIGSNVTISDGAKLLTRGLDIKDYPTNAKKKERDHIDESIEIGDRTWIAANVIILPGVHVAPYSIVAAGAVVTKNLDEAGCVYGGIPAKKIRQFDRGDLA